VRHAGYFCNFWIPAVLPLTTFLGESHHRQMAGCGNLSRMRLGANETGSALPHT
jgi:hypothetical protein